MPEEWLPDAVYKYRDFDKWSQVVEAVGTSAIHHSCAIFVTSDFQNKRGLIQLEMERQLRLKLEPDSETGKGGVFSKAISLQLNNVELPGEYSEAVRRKQAASEDIELAVNQRTQNLTSANTKLLAAQEEGRKIRDSAINDANITMTEAGLEAESVLFSYETEALTLVTVRSALNLSTEGVLTYMANKLYEEVKELKVQTGEPAKTSYRDEL